MNLFLTVLSKNRWTIVLFILVSIIYFAIRLPNLTYQPIFADEAIYIRWAQVMKSEPTLRFLPLSDGKTPLFMWIMMPVFKLIDDPLLAGRILAVFSGFGTLLGVFLLGVLFLNKRVALFSIFLMAITPYIVFFDRMALVDSMLAMFTIWSLFLVLLLVKFSRIDLAMLLGFVMGAGIITKTPGMFNLVSIPFAAITLNLSGKQKLLKVLKVVGLFLLAIAIALGIYNALRLGPGFSSLGSRNEDYVRSPFDVIQHPLDPFIPHLRDLSQYWVSLLGYPVILLILLGVVLGLIKKNRYIISILLFASGPLFVQMCLLQTFTARYLLFSIAPLLVIASFGIDWMISYFNKYRSVLTLTVILILLVWPTFFISKLLFDIENAPLSPNERRGYLEDWTAGYGLREISHILDDQSKKELIIVGTEGSFGTLPDGLQIYFDKNRQVIFKPGKATVSAELRKEALTKPTFYVANELRFNEFNEGVKLLQRFPKAKPLDKKNLQDATVLYKVIP